MKQLLTFLVLMCSYVLCGAQAASLTVDNQTPGWLSSKINYGDQQTVENLTVSGYLNPDDLKFIGSLLNHSLTGKVDIEQCQMVDKNGQITTILDGCIFNNSGRLRKLVMPISLSSINNSIRGILVDTLVVGGQNLPIITQNAFNEQSSHSGAYVYNYGVKNLILREGVEEIADDCFIAVTNTQNGGGENYKSLLNSNWKDATVLESVHLPLSLKKIGNRSFLRCLNLKDVNLPDSIDTIGDRAFACTSFQPDTLVLPQALKWYYMSSFYIKNGQTIIVPDIQYIGFGNSNTDKGTYVDKNDAITLYMSSTTKPGIINKPTEKCLSNCTIYVPKGSLQSYKTPDFNQASNYEHNPFVFANVIELIPISNIEFVSADIAKHVDETFNIIPLITPSDATFKNLIWESSNPSVATVSNDGTITALAYGTTIITASDADKCHSASFTLTVFEYVTSISLQKSVNVNIGNKVSLTATLHPLDKTDGQIIWKSNDVDIATVDETGIIKGIAKGVCNITATSVDGNHAATCIVNVIQPVESIFLSSNELSVTVGENKVVIATVLPSNANNKEINWRSADESVATVDNNGKITAIEGGVVEILASSVENPEIKDKCIVTVIQPVGGVTINKSVLELTEDESERLIVSIIPDSATNKSVNWTSSDVSVAMVSPDGTVYALKAGQATIMATTIDGGFVALCKVTVKAKTVLAESLSLSSTTSEMTIGETLQLSATVLPENTTNKNVRWTSTDTEIATVAESGLVTAIKEGNVQIIASTTDGSNLSAICEISISKKFIPVSQIVINPSSVRLAIGETLSLYAQIIPSESTNKNVNWSSTNSSVVSVNSDGLLTANSVGTATVIASTQDGTNLSATCTVEVYEPTVLISTITIDPSAITGKIGDTYQLVANIKPDDATEKSVTWSSDNSAVATVDSTGLIALLSKGNAIIKASATDGSGVTATCVVVVDEYSGITDIEIAPDTNVKIYNINGILVYEGAYAHSNLTPGTYIIISQGNSIKRIIR